jgi:hypothetical protein
MNPCVGVVVNIAATIAATDEVTVVKHFCQLGCTR